MLLIKQKKFQMLMTDLSKEQSLMQLNKLRKRDKSLATKLSAREEKLSYQLSIKASNQSLKSANLSIKQGLMLKKIQKAS